MNRILTVTLNPAIDQTLEIADFAVGRVNRVIAEQVHAGGKGVNVAVVAKGLGAVVCATGIRGEGNAEIFEVLLRGDAIEDQFVQVPGGSRVGIKIVDPAGGMTTDINMAGAAIPAWAVAEVFDRITHRVVAGGWVVLAGSVPAGVPENVYAELIDRVHQRGGWVALDTSGEPLRLALQRGPDFVKPNADELAEIMSHPLETLDERVAAVHALISQFGVKCAALSMGADGAIFASGGETVVARPPSVKVRSTVGAGDSMVAGAVFAMMGNQPLVEVARLATALGADAVTRVGVGIDAGRSFEALIAKVDVQHIN